MMTFQEALQKLNIEDYADRIFNSNSHGELFHCWDYISITKAIKDDATWFRPWFEEVVKWAEANWERPESIFQHIITILQDAQQGN